MSLPRWRLSSACLLCALVTTWPAAAAPSPNVLVVSIDTLRPMNLSSYGYERLTSPNIDRLLSEGARFTEARTVVPLTAPALASMLTALEPHEHGSTRNGLRVRPNLFSFSKALGRRGYRTAAFVGNWTLREQLSGLDEHFESYTALLNRSRWFGLGKREATADDLVDAALEWLDEQRDREPERPVLLWVHMVEPHAPYRLQKEFLDQIGLKASGSMLSAGKRYDSEIAFADDRTGRLVDEVFERLGRERVVTIFLADHGESLGEHGYWGHGRHVYDATLRIPLGIVWPGRIEPAVIEEPALITDLPRTVLGLLDLPMPEFVAGFDWSRVLLEGAPAGAGRVTRYQSHRGSVEPKEEQTELRARGLLEVARLENGVKEIYRVPNRRLRRFNVAQDPNEERDLSSSDGEVSKELREWLAEVRKGLTVADDLPPPNLTDEDLEALRALGYID